MEDTIRRLARVLGASGIEHAGHDTRFAVDGAEGARLRISVEGQQQRFMAVLKDANDVVRCTVDVAPVTHVTEDPAFPHRVTLHVGAVHIQIDSQPTLAVEVTTTR